MRISCVRLAIYLFCIVAMLQVDSGAARAQRQRQQRRPGSRTAQSQRQGSPRPTAQRQANAAGIRQQSTAAKPQTQSAPPILEKADPETRAAFLKLIGANWIWSPAHAKDEVPVGDCFFRKTFQVQRAEMAQVHVACDNQYELYVNGRLAGSGNDWRKMDVHDVTPLLRPGKNVVAIKASNTDPGAAGLVARVIVKQPGTTLESYSSDASWRTSVKEFGNWTQPNVRDAEWLPAKVYGPLGGVLPWGDEIVIAEEGSRFIVDREFVIDRLITDEQAGSLIAMAFNASGDILASQENGPLLLVRDTNADGKPDTVKPFCTDIRNVQGILPLGKRVYAVGDGPDGGALYQISDDNGDGRSDAIATLVRYRGAIGEHGPHTVRLGPDGLLYVLSGNFARVDAELRPQSAYGAAYEGDLTLPKYEDPNGHAVGLTAPGATIIRTDMSGSFVELVAGGFRNPYDFAFNTDGELFTYDADMEWDIGAPWYRPTRVAHVPAGGDFGWRSGWSKWPEYYIDSLPATLNIGPGSPTGMVYYEHVMYPVRLQNTLFIGDWATGQIHAVKLERSGASYTAKFSTFVKGRPLNVTALDVGPDGALYFATGGRGTDGGIYRVRWTGTAPPTAIQFGKGIEQALHQPQIHSDWARMRIAAVKRSLGNGWQSDLQRVLNDRSAPMKDRLRAVELLTYFGPTPTPQLVVQLAHDGEPAMRVRAARLMGALSHASFNQPLASLLDDSDAWVRRVACEAVAHRAVTVSGEPAGNVPVAALVRLLEDRDRFVAFSARRALEKVPAEKWEAEVLGAAKPRTFLQGATGLLTAHPSREAAEKVIARCEAMIGGEVNEPGRKPGEMSDPIFQDLLRVLQLALVRGEIKPEEARSLSQVVVREYPTRSHTLNRELVKLLAYLQPPEAPRALAQQLQADIPDVEKLHIAAYAARITNGWQTDDKLAMLRYYEQARGMEGGHSVAGYIEYFARDFFTNLSLAERKQVLAAGENFPTSALSVIAGLPENPGGDVLAELRALDQRLEGMPGEPIARLRVGIVAVLGQSGEEESLAYLRNVYLADPQRRAPVAMSLTQHPDGENWPILVDSLRTIEGEAAKEVLGTLVKIARRPETSEPYRNAILLGLRLQTSGGDLATRLLEHWLNQTPYEPNAPLETQLAAWQKWYAETFPSELPAELPKEAQPNKWSYEELASFLESPEGKAGSPSRGAQVFTDAQCIKCHRFNGRGEGIGPDLTTVAQRFQAKEILESIVYPNQVVSDQYASQIVISNGKTYTGIAARDANGNMTVLQSDGTKVQLAADEIEEVETSKASSMPEGLLNTLTLEQVADLFALLMNSPKSAVAGHGQSAAR